MSDDFNPLFNFLPLPDEPVRPEQINDYLRQIADSLLYLDEQLSMAVTQLPRHVPNQYYIQAGVNDDVDSGSTPEDMWTPGGILTYPPTAATTTIVSSDANDTLAGTGMQKVWVRGVDNDYNDIEDVVDMNGTTPVALPRDYLFINKMIGIQVGTADGTNIGDIDAFIGGTLVRRIGAGQGMCTCSHIVIPKPLRADEYPFIESLIFEAGRNNGFVVIDLIVQPPPYATQPPRTAQSFAVSADGGSTPGFIHPFPIYIPPGTRVTQRIQETSGNNMIVRSTMDVVYQAVEPEAIPFMLNSDLAPQPVP